MCLQVFVTKKVGDKREVEKIDSKGRNTEKRHVRNKFWLMCNFLQCLKQLYQGSNVYYLQFLFHLLFLILNIQEIGN